MSSEWININDKLPIDPNSVYKFESIDILIVSGGQTEFCEYTCGPSPEPWHKFGNYHEAYITDWMFKPSPPNTTQKSVE